MKMRLVVSAIAAFVLGSVGASAQGAPSAAAGQVLFKARCAACHTTAAGAKPVIAPNLAGLVGRKAGSSAYASSPALKAYGQVWSKTNLDAFLTAPYKLVPGTRMVISISDAKQRADVVAYLATLK
jgi:cytochrome c